VQRTVAADPGLWLNTTLLEAKSAQLGATNDSGIVNLRTKPETLVP
jgi:hypothetical protein